MVAMTSSDHIIVTVYHFCLRNVNTRVLVSILTNKFPKIHSTGKHTRDFLSATVNEKYEYRVNE